MIRLVVDASVAVKWFVRDSNEGNDDTEEKDVVPALDLLAGGLQVRNPSKILIKSAV